MTASIQKLALALALSLSLTASLTASWTAAKAQTVAGPNAAPLLTTVEQKLAEGPAGARFGVLVTTLDGEVLVAIAPDQRA